jgi:Fanconi anemia group I protein
MFRDILLSPAELKFVLEKIIRMFPDLDFEELPPLVFQLLLLSTKVSLAFFQADWNLTSSEKF